MNKGKILIIEDSKETLKILKRILTSEGYIVITAIDGEIGLNLVNTDRPEIILLDIMMPKMNGFEVCKRLKKNPQTASIPVIFISALEKPENKVKGFEVGGVDYITKPLNPQEIYVRIEHQLTIVRLQKQLMRQNEQLQKSEKHLLTIVNSMSDSIVIINQEARIIYVNPAAQHLWGQNAEQLVGKTFNIPKKIGEVREIKIQKQNGSIIIAETRTEEIIWENQPAYLMCLIDITKRKETEGILQQAKVAAERANLAKSAFIGTVSHELRTPLNSILGFTQILLNDSQLNSQQQEHINIINNSGKNLLSLINDILEISKIEAGGIKLSEKSFNLNNMLKSLENMFKQKAENKGLELIFDYQQNLPLYLKTDEGKLRQILLNLLNNAIKFTEKGKVSLRVFIEQESLKSLKSGEAITLGFEVEDTGPGFSEQEMQLLFEAFQKATQTKNQAGTGLGLFLCREFAKALGGKIKVTSAVGKGSIFRLSVPVKISDLSAIKQSPPSQKVLRLAEDSDCRILVVDQSQENSKLLDEMLSPLGFDVQIANNGKSAHATDKTFTPHLIFIDIKMLLTDKVSATQVIKKYHGKPTKIIALTADMVEELEARKVGFDDFVSLPFQENILLEKIAKYLNVSYIYAEEKTPTLVKSETEKMLYLGVMPQKWLTSLYNSAAGADPEQIMSLLEAIPKKYISLKKAIADLANNFAFEKIMELTKEALGEIKEEKITR